MLPKIVSLFSGAGGLDLGFKNAGFTISVAMDLNEAAINTHRRNFPETHAVVADLSELKPEGVLEIIKGIIKPNERIAVIGGPPCQGFSRGNAGSKTDDPRNSLPTLYSEIIGKLKATYIVEFIIFENVPGMKDEKHIDTYKSFVNDIKNLAFDTEEIEVCASDYGVAQKRPRIILYGKRNGQKYTGLVLEKKNTPITVQAVIGNLDEPAFYRRNLTPEEIPVHPNHWTMNPKSKKFADPEKLMGKGRSFRRLKWDAPCPTIAYGNREIYVHPRGTRRLSIYESLLLQGFPPSFVLEGNLTEQVEQVSNAVPPPLAQSLAIAVKSSLQIGET